MPTLNATDRTNLTLNNKRFRAPHPRCFRLFASLTALFSIFCVAACGEQAKMRSSDHQNELSSIASATVASLFPADGADIAHGTQTVQFFTQSVTLRAIDRCLASRGLPPAPTAIRNPDKYGGPGMPNLPAVRANGVLGFTTLYAAPKSVEAHMAASERRAYQAAETRCARDAPHFAVDSPSALALESQWNQIEQQSLRTPVLQAAVARGAQCSSSTSFPATSINGEMTVIDNEIARGIKRKTHAQLVSVERAGVRVLLKCFAPAIQLQNKIFQKQRNGFLASHALAVRQVETQTTTQISRDAAQFGVRYLRLR